MEFDYLFTVSDSTVPGSVIFPLSCVAFLPIPLANVTCTDPKTNNTTLTQELHDRLDRFLQVHRKCYSLCLAPLHGSPEKHAFALIQKEYLDSRLEMLKVHNNAEAVKCMVTIAKSLCKPTGDLLSERLNAVINDQLGVSHITTALRQLGLNVHECQVVEDRLGNMKRVAMATRDELLDCSLDSTTVDRLYTFFH
ncbi:protein SPO16 homolog [Mya arenaria]|uniref:protein SPO16 homolog n=1 Tax=Mya arenaria TaxID=6604 RepID=UPI0022DEBAC8|nr:protein SPO16 homolog [Mya arenaria]